MELVHLNSIPLMDWEHLTSTYFSHDKENVLKLFNNLKTVFLIKNTDQTIGFINLKQFKHTMYIPIYLTTVLTHTDCRYLFTSIKTILKGYEYSYLVFFIRNQTPNALDTFRDYLEIENMMLSFSKSATDIELERIENEFNWTEVIPHVTELKSLYNHCFVDEKEYVGPSWDVLIDNFMEELSPKICISCWYQNQLVGNLLAIHHDNYSYLYSICSEPAFRGRKIGAHLMCLFLNQRLGKEVRLQVYSENKAGIALYEKFGFELVGIASLVAREIKIS